MLHAACCLRRLPKRQVRLFKLANDVTYKRYRHAMNDLLAYPADGCAARVRDVLLGAAAPHFRALPPPDARAWVSYNASLNEPQVSQAQSLCRFTPWRAPRGRGGAPLRKIGHSVRIEVAFLVRRARVF